MKNYLITTFMSTLFLMTSIFGTVDAQETGIAPNAISEGIYFEVSYFTNGEKHIQKRYKTKTY